MHVVAAHQRDILAAVYAALGDHQATRRHPLEQTERGFQPGVESPQVTVIDAHQIEIEL